MFDSGALTIIDCYVQLFPVMGTFAYRLVEPGVMREKALEYPFTVIVQAATGGDPKQQDITVKQSGEGLVADPGEVTVHAGDAVLWHTPDAGIQGFGVEIRLPDDKGIRAQALEVEPDQAASFDVTGSLAMHNNAFFSHAFGLPGDYRWVDLNGSDVGGIIHVRTMEIKTDQDQKAWLDKLEEGTLIVIQGGGVDNPDIEILAGQTVAWSIHSAPGMRISVAPPINIERQTR